MQLSAAERHPTGQSAESPCLKAHSAIHDFGGARLNSRTIESQTTFTSSVNPAIGLAGGGGAGCACASCTFNFSPNWPISCEAKLWIIPEPRPYCAIAPDSFTLV